MSMFHSMPRSIICRLQYVHRDQSGSISIVSVFALMLLTMLLGLVMNSGRQVDQKIKMQNAADAATYSGGVVFARSMNTLAFTNHLLSDVFALTAFLREAEARSSAQFPSEILDEWEQIGPVFSQSKFQKFADLGQAITAKVPKEREMVRSYTAWAAAAAESFLPAMEAILEEQAIPEFQRALVQSAPGMMQYATQEVARRHGQAWPRDTVVNAALWRTSAEVIGAAGESQRRTLPVVDPELDSEPNQQRYFNRARKTRDQLAYRYLSDWNNETMQMFDLYGKMSQFGNLWRIFTCGQLRQLLELEYPDTNLPFMIRTLPGPSENNATIERDYMVVGATYRTPEANYMRGIFDQPLQADQTAYAQAMVFVPRQRLIWWNERQALNNAGNSVPAGGVPGHIVELPTPPEEPREQEADGGDETWYVSRQDWVRMRIFIPEQQRYEYRYFQAGDQFPEAWSLFTQNWAVQLVPATATQLPQILSTSPTTSAGATINAPEVQNLTLDDLEWINNH